MVVATILKCLNRCQMYALRCIWNSFIHFNMKLINKTLIYINYILFLIVRCGFCFFFCFILDKFASRSLSLEESIISSWFNTDLTNNEYAWIRDVQKTKESIEWYVYIKWWRTWYNPFTVFEPIKLNSVAIKIKIENYSRKMADIIVYVMYLKDVFHS